MGWGILSGNATSSLPEESDQVVDAYQDGALSKIKVLTDALEVEEPSGQLKV